MERSNQQFEGSGPASPTDDARAVLAAIVTTSPDGIIGQDLTGRVTVWNEGAGRLYGWTAAEMVGASVFRTIPRDYQDEWRFLLERVKRGERVQELTTRRQTKTGRQIDVSLTVAPVRGPKGRILGASTIERDVTRRRRIDSLLDGQRRMLESLSRGGNLGDALRHLLDATNGLTTGNVVPCIMKHEPERHLLVPAASRLPRAVEEALAAGIPIAPGGHPSGAAAFRAQAVNTNAIEREEGWNGLRDIVLEAGLRSCCSTPIRSPGGDVIGTLDLYAPLPGEPRTDDLEAAAALAQTAGLALERFDTIRELRLRREVLAALYEINGLIVNELDVDRIIARVTEEATRLMGAQAGAFFYNDSTAIGFRLYSLAGPMRDRFADLEMPRNTPLFNQTITSGAIQRFDDVTKDPRYGKNEPLRGLPPQHPKVCSFMSAPVSTRSGELIGMLLFGHESPNRFSRWHEDVLRGVAQQTALALDTARLYQQAADRAEALSEADRKKNEFLALLGHELRNPLSAMASGLSLIQGALPEDDTTREAVDILNRQATHMRRLVDDLLDVGRITKGRIDLDRYIQDLRERLRSAVAGARPLALERAQQIDLRLPEKPVWADADAVRIEQIVGNLLHNAMRFSPKGAVIDVVLRAEGEEGVIVVRDRGRGIAEDQLAKIFDMFVQAERPEGAHRSGGLGLGLTLVRELTGLHGGTVRARSAGLGEGSAFEVRLPLAVAGAVPAAPAPIQPEPAAAHRAPEPPGAPEPARTAPRELARETPRETAPSASAALMPPPVTPPAVGAARPAPSPPIHPPVRTRPPAPERRLIAHVPISQVPLHDAPEGPQAVLRILLAEDQPDAGRALSLLLEGWGHRVTHVTDGMEALEAARARHPDVALLDIELPDIDGWELARDLIRSPGLRDIRLAVLSGRGQRADRNESRAAGFERHFVKPVDPRRLHEWLRKIAAEISA